MKAVPEIYFSENIVNPMKFQVIPFESLKNIFAKPLNHDPFQAHLIKFNVLLFITSGNPGIHTIDFEDYHYERDSVILVSKEQIHAFRDLPNKNKGYIVLFTEELFLEVGATNPFLINHFYNAQLYTPILKLGATKYNELERLLLKLAKEISIQEQSVWMEIAKSYFKILLLELYSWRETKTEQIEKSPELDDFIKFQMLLRDNLTQEKKVKFYAEKLNVTAKKLNSITQSSINLSAKDFILSTVILEAKRYLKGSDLSSKEIAYKLGFDEPTNFTKFFKKHTQMLPSEFAQSN